MRADGAKGHLDLLLLAVLSSEPRHGYAVIAGLRERTAGALELAEGAVYPALHRLEDGGLLQSQWEPVAGRRRRVYAVTPSGRDALAHERRSWAGLVASVEAVLRPLPSATLTPA